MLATANRGKTTEAAVKKKLVTLESAGFCHYRLPDMHAGSRTATLSDFLICKSGKLTLLEVKQVNHTHLLPYKNLGLDQIAKLRMWKSAGAQGHVLVYHTPSKLWRAADVSWFFLNYTKTNEAGKAVGSWDLRELSTITLDDYFGSFL